LPLPGSGPRGEGMVASALVAIHRAPARIATQASASSAQPTAGPYPCTTATGRAAASVTTRSPTARTSSLSAAAPTTSTGDAGGGSAASTPAAARADVTISSGSAGTPISVSSSATSAGVRDALFVAKAIDTPARTVAVTAAGAPATGSVPR